MAAKPMDAKTFAIQCHRDVNQKYRDLPYEYHLLMVVRIALKFIHLIPEEDQKDVIDGCWVHDVIEDTGKTYNDVKRATNEAVAEYAYALTNEKGKTRKERANEKYYRGIHEYKHATFIKLCDRYANMEFSYKNGDSMYKKYVEEMKDFQLFLKDERYGDLWKALEELANK